MGLRSSQEFLESPFNVSPFLAWPFPSLHRTYIGMFLASEIGLHSVDVSRFPWASANIETFDYYNPSQTKAVVGGGAWHAAELGRGLFLTNGQCLVVRTFNSAITGVPDRFYVVDRPVSSVCGYKGRVVFGGLPEGLWSADWTSILEAWVAKSPMAVDHISQLDQGANMVWWSSIGGDTMALLTPPDNPLYLFERNEMGFMPMPWDGKVLAVKSLQDGVMVYGDHGIVALRPILDPFPTFGATVLANFGISGRGSVGGDHRGHTFLDEFGDLWRVGGNFQLQRLGYREFLGHMIGQEMVISHDAWEDEFYVCGENSLGQPQSWLLTPQGLGSCKRQATSVIRHGGRLYGVWHDVAGDEALVTTDVVDFKNVDAKTITTIELGLTTEANVWVGADYRYGPADAWREGPWVPVNSWGYARVQKTANEFRVKIKADHYDLKLDYINVKWQQSGHRTIRGLSVNTAGAESS